jgi:hypothetical protein
MHASVVFVKTGKFYESVVLDLFKKWKAMYLLYPWRIHVVFFPFMGW